MTNTNHEHKTYYHTRTSNTTKTVALITQPHQSSKDKSLNYKGISDLRLLNGLLGLQAPVGHRFKLTNDTSGWPINTSFSFLYVSTVHSCGNLRTGTDKLSLARKRYHYSLVPYTLFPFFCVSSCRRVKLQLWGTLLQTSVNAKKCG